MEQSLPWRLPSEHVHRPTHRSRSTLFPAKPSQNTTETVKTQTVNDAADVRAFFDSVSQNWLIRFLEHRIGDPRIIRLIRKWLTAGVLENGVVTTSEMGTGQGSVISPLLANVYLHSYSTCGPSAGDGATPRAT